MVPGQSASTTKTALIKRTPAYRQSLARAVGLLKHPDRLERLLAGASQKAEQHRTLLAGMGESLNASFRLVRAYSAGDYREIPWRQMVLLIASLVYLIVPTDLVPDIVIAAGYIDDAMLLTWTLKTLSGELRRFRHWEEGQTTATTESTSAGPGS